MTVQDIIHTISTDKVALFFLFALLPFLAFGLNKLTKVRGLQSPYTYIYSTIIYISGITGILSSVLWLYTMFFDQKGLWQLNPFVFYLPLISMVATFYIVKKRLRIGDLPWFGELYELLTALAVAFAITLTFVHTQAFPLSNMWLIMVLGMAIFLFLKLGWDAVTRIR